MHGEFIYFLVMHNGLIKIGYSKKLQKRLTTHSIYMTEFLGAFPGTMDDEKAVHKKFEHRRASTKEFFSDCQEIRDFIKERATITTFEVKPRKPKTAQEIEAQMKAVKSGKRLDPVVLWKIFYLYKQGDTNETIIKKIHQETGVQWSMSKIIKLRTKFNAGFAPQDPYGEGMIVTDLSQCSDTELLAECIKRKLNHVQALRTEFLIKELNERGLTFTVSATRQIKGAYG